MFCPSCGAESVEGFKYCKRCGANVAAADSQSPVRKVPISFTIVFLLVIGAIFCVGIGLPLAASTDLIRGGFTPGDIMVLSLADIAVTLTVVGLLVWAYLRITTVRQLRAHSADVGEISRIDTARRQVAAPPESVSSVTENTTRTLEGRHYETPRSL